MVRSSAQRTEHAVDDIGESAERANERVSESTRRTGEETEKTEKKFKGYAEELSEVNKLLEKDGENTTLLAQKKELLKKAVDDTADKLNEFADRQQEVTRAYNNGDVPDEEYRAFQRQIIATEQELENYRRELENVGGASSDVAENTENKLGSAFSSIAAGAAATAAAVASVSVGIGAAAVSSSDSLEKAAKKIISATGASVDGLEDMEKVISDIYSDNFGENFDDIADSISKITQNLGEMNETSLVNVTESAYALQDVFEMGVDESSRAAKAMMQNFNISAAQAYDYIAKGAQNGLNYSGELLDSISEYSVQFKKMGLDADDMFNIFAAGAESGAWNLDKVGDAIKEMSIRVIDGSDSTAEGFEKIGLNADVMSAKFAQGGDIARKAFSETLKALSELDDPLAQDAAGVALLGTMWEDLGSDAVSALAEISGSAYDCAGALDSIKGVNYSSLSDALDGLKRQVEMLIQPLGDSLIPLVDGVIVKLSEIADDVVPRLIGSVEPLIGSLEPLIQPLMELAAGVLPLVVEMLTPVITAVSELVQTVLPPLAEFLSGELIPVITDLVERLSETVFPIITELVASLLPPVMDILTAILPLLDTAMLILEAVLPILSQLTAPIVELLKNGLVPLVQELALLINEILIPLIPLITEVAKMFAEDLGNSLTFVTDLLSTVMKHFENVFSNIRQTFSGLIDFITGVFSGDWEKAWNGITKIFSGIWNNIKSVAEFVVNGIVDTINTFLGGINATFGWLGIKLEPISHVDWTADNAEEQAIAAVNSYNGSSSVNYDPTAHYRQKDMEAKQRGRSSAAVPYVGFPAATDSAISGAGSSSYASSAKTYSPVANTNDYSGRTSSGNSRNFISISSYIPTVWSGGDHSELLNSLIGSDLMGNSAAAHSIDALTSGEITSSGSSASGETDLADVVNAITKLQRKVEALDMNLEIELKARDLTIGKVAVKDINDLAKQSGKSPFTF